ncbi:histidine phosphatase family protein [Mesorhizobium sp. CN2-181]|uniref:SixA phosphatase family protein n=1 Tax=Mesorhizobium yinganensis TaxID=3157707 RepID=UPI0032B82E79
MSTLYLLRHAKAGWAQPGMRDFDRPLDAAGVRDAEKIGSIMRGRAYVPDLTLCSTALRARQTLEGVAGHADIGRAVFIEALYSEDAAGYLSIVHKQGGHGSLLIIGHNPMMEDLAIAVAGAGEAPALHLLRSGFPTSGLAVIGFQAPLSEARPGQGHVEAFVTPADS